MFKDLKISKAFTLAEVFVAMVVLSILVSVCIAFFTNRKDYEREYFYYSAYKNLQNVVDTALLNDKYLTGTTPRVEETVCGDKDIVCRAFKTDAGNLCNIFSDYFNIVGEPVCSVAVGAPPSSFPADRMAMKLTNGMEIYFETLEIAQIDTSIDTIASTEFNGWNIWVDLNGSGHGEDKVYYDIVPFGITLSGKVLPWYGKVEGIRGYEFAPADKDAGGNPSLAAFDVVYTPENSNLLTVASVTEGANIVPLRSVSFWKAACYSGYYKNSANTRCKDDFGVENLAASCTFDYADCKIRLVKKLKRTK